MSLLAMQDSDAAAAEVLLAKNLEELSPSSPDTRLQRALSYFTLGMLKVERRDDAGALAASRVLPLALRREALGNDHPWVAEVENALALADYNAGRYLDAERRWQTIVPSYRKYFGDEHPEYSKHTAELRADSPGARQFRGSRETLPPVRRHRPQGQSACTTTNFAYSLKTGWGWPNWGSAARARPRPTSTKVSRSRASIGIACARRSS